MYKLKYIIYYGLYMTIWMINKHNSFLLQQLILVVLKNFLHNFKLLQNDSFIKIQLFREH